MILLFYKSLYYYYSEVKQENVQPFISLTNGILVYSISLQVV